MEQDMTYEETLKEMALADERYVVMTAENRAAIRNLPDHLPGRFIDTGITEQAMVGIAAGLALRGRIPITHALATFLTMRAFEFIRTDVGIAGLPVKFVGGVPGFLSDGNGPTHQAIEDVSIMRGIPNMHVFCPADADDMVLGMRDVFAAPNPVYFRHISHPAVIEHQPFTYGRAEQVLDGEDITLMVYGLLFREAYAAAQLLETAGYSVRLLNMRMLKPVDEAAILRAARETKLIVTIEDHFLTGGLYSIVSEILVRAQILAPVLPFALAERWFKPALLDEVLAHEGFTAEQITAKITERLARAES
jgi:transketolase